jgi:hypothetical protein
MLSVARELVGDAVQELRQLTLPHDLLPRADAIVAVGQPLSYLPDTDAGDQALVAIATALRPGGVLAVDICDLEWEHAWHDVPLFAEATQDWAIITKFSMPAADWSVLT